MAELQTLAHADDACAAVPPHSVTRGSHDALQSVCETVAVPPEDPDVPQGGDATGADNPSGQSCDTCYYYRGECKRYPQAVPKQPKDWSGEWKAKDDAANQNEEAGEPAGMDESAEGEFGG